MSKRKKIILISVFIIVLIIITAISVNGALNFPKTDEESVRKANLEATQEALEKKEQFAKDGQNRASVENYVEEDFSEEELQQIEAQKQKVEAQEQKIMDIMNRFYPEEFNKAVEDVENDNKGITSMKNTELLDSQKRLYNLVLKVLEEEDLSDDDANVLKDFLTETKLEISKDEELNARAEKILSE